MRNKYIWSFVFLLTIYVILAFSLPTDPDVLNRYSFSQTEARLLNLTVVVPLLLIYLTALYGFIRFKGYAHSIRDSKEGQPLQIIAKGLMILAFSLPINSVAGSLLSYIKHRHPGFESELTITRNYLTLILALLAIYFIAQGIQRLYETLSKRNKPTSLPIVSILVPTLLASIYTWLTMTRVSDAGITDAYHLPSWILLSTIIIPFSFVWSLGLRAVFQLYDYQQRVKGIVYKQALTYVSIGIGVLVLVSVLLQLLTTLSEQLNRLNLTPLLGIVYVLVILYAIGYGLVARGAKKLKQIEDV
jgi:hypothetical protein